MDDKKKPLVGIGILIVKNNKVLLTKRKGSHGAGEYASPGGHLEFEESIIDCVKREVLEETGIKIKNIQFIRISNIVRYRKHYLDIGLTADWASGDPTVLEPDKAGIWEWYDINNLPKPLFLPIKHTLQALKTNRNFFDS